MLTGLILFVCRKAIWFGLLVWELGAGQISNMLPLFGKKLFCVMILFVLLYPLFALGMMGAGDIKLLLLGAIILPFSRYWMFFAASFFIAAIISVMKICTEQNAKERIQYFFSYVCELAGSKKAGVYFKNEERKRKATVHLASPMLVGFLIQMWLVK